VRNPRRPGARRPGARRDGPPLGLMPDKDQSSARRPSAIIAGSGSRPTAPSNRWASRTVRTPGPHPTSRSLPLPSRPSSSARRASRRGE
jgi:hypothetical protein